MHLSSNNLQENAAVISIPENHQAFEKLEQGVMASLETYSNVHRGTGHFSMVSTELFERARMVLIEYLKLDIKEHTVVFCTPYGLKILETKLRSKNYQIVSSRDMGLPLGLRALGIKKRDLPKGIPFHTGGGVVKIVSPDSVIWDDVPQKFEAGTPNIINAIAFSIALILKRQFGNDCFKSQDDAALSAADILYQDELTKYSGLQLLAELGKQLVGRDLTVPTEEGEKPYINLDNAASTPTFFPIWNVVRKVWRQPGKVHADIVREVKKIVTIFLNASMEEYETIFTRNATEAINIAVNFIQNEFRNDKEFVILNTLLEHHSNELPWRYIPGASLVRLSVDNEGFINLNELEHILRKYNQDRIYGKKRIRIVAVNGASNVIGTFNDIEAISRIAHKYDARILVDGAQVVAHRSVNIDKLGIDYFVFSGHKIYAPFGSGALLVRKEYIRVDHSELERIKTSGEENVAGIAALGKAITLLQRVGMDVIEEREKKMINRLLDGFSGIHGIEEFGIKDRNSKRLHQKGGIVSFSLKRVPHNLVVKELAEQGGIGARNGCFCAHLLVKHLLRIHSARAFAANVSLILAPRFTRVILPGLVRVSFGLENDENDVDKLISILRRIDESPYSIINKLIAFTRNGTPFIKHTIVQEQISKFLKTRIQKVYSLNSDGLLRNNN